MNLRDLQYLVAAADLQHFGRAAEYCHVSQPTLSTQIRKLEEYLHVEIFERCGRQVVLTPLGAHIVERARAMLREYREMQYIARSAADPFCGELRMGAFPTLAPYLLPHIVPPLHARYPELKLILIEEKTEQLLHRLHAGTLDVALLAMPLGEQELEYLALFDEPFLLAVSPRHPLAKAARVSVDQLATENLLLLEEGHCLRSQALNVCELAGAQENAEFRATSLETLKQMVASDMGVTLVPALAAREPGELLCYVPFRHAEIGREIALVWRRSASRTHMFQEVGQVFRELTSHLPLPPPLVQSPPLRPVRAASGRIR